MKLELLRHFNLKRTEEYLTLDEMDILYLSTAIGGETGELLNLIKKASRHKRWKQGADRHHAPDIQDIKNEMADVIIYLDLLAAKLDIDLSEVVIDKFNATSDKYNFQTKIKDETDEEDFLLELLNDLRDVEDSGDIYLIRETVAERLKKLTGIRQDP